MVLLIVLRATEAAVVAVRAEMEVAVTKRSLSASTSIILCLKITAHLIHHIDLTPGKFHTETGNFVTSSAYCASLRKLEKRENAESP